MTTKRDEQSQQIWHLPHMTLFLSGILINIFRLCLQQEIAKNGNISECWAQ